MATSTTKPELDVTSSLAGGSVPAWPRGQSASLVFDPAGEDRARPSHHDALQALLAFSSLHEQVRRRKMIAARSNGFDAGATVPEFDQGEQFLLDEVLQLVAERAVAITGADGLAIALAENNEIVLRAAAGSVRPDVGARIERDSAFSGACFRTAQIVMCDDTETDTRVNVEACRKLGARSMVAVPLCGRRRVIGLLEAFSEWPFAFNESDIRNLSLLAELVLGALKPEDEDRFAESAKTAVSKLEAPAPPVQKAAPVEPPKPTSVTPVESPKVSTVAAVQATPVSTAPSIAVPVAVVPPAIPVTPVPVVDFKPAVSVAVVAKDVPAAKASAATAAILDKLVEKESNVETVVAPEILAAPEIAEEEVATRGRPMVLALVIFFVIVAAFAGGVWWKLKTAQLGSAIVQPQANQKTLTPSGTNAQPGTTATPASVKPTNENPAADASTPEGTPASAQEMSKFPQVTGIRHWSSSDSSTIVLDLQDQVQYEAHRLAGPDRIYFDLRDTQLAADLVGKSIDIGDAFVTRIRMAQPVAGMTRVVLETKPNSTFSVSLEPNPYRLVVMVRKIGANPKGAINLFPITNEAQRNTLAIIIPPPTKEDLQLRARVPKMRIVVDAGHGGWDLGTVGRRGLLEKDLVLEIAQRLGKLLESRLGTEVIYTRPDDNYVTLDERASIANQSQADLFVSVHANYSDLPSARGVETYYTNFFSAPGSKDVDTRISIDGTKPAVTATLSPADLHERIEQSRRLAASVQHSLYGTLSVQNPGLRDRGIKEAGFVVLTGSAMPGILAEVSFVSSPTDEQKLRSDGYREQIAEALYKGIARYAVASRGVKLAAK